MEIPPVFLACPIGPDASDVRKHSDNVARYLIEPAVRNALGAGAKALRADQIGTPGRITHQILQHLVHARVVIADLTGLNSNVLYELGIRQAQVKPYILIAEKETELPFDLRNYRTVFFTLQLGAIESAVDELSKHLEAALKGDVDPEDERLFGPRIATEPQYRPSDTDILLNALGDLSAAAKATHGMLGDVKTAMESAIGSRSSGSYDYIEGEAPAFAELIAATLRAKDHVRSTRFFSSAITGNQPEYAAAIKSRVIGNKDFPPLSHYSRIIQTNNPAKLADVNSYLREFSGKPFTFYLTPHSNNFEMVIIDEAEVFIHFHAKQSVIGSTIHIFGTEVASRFIGIFDRLHDPLVYPGVDKFDCKYITSPDQIEEDSVKIRSLFERRNLPHPSNPS